MRIYRLTTNELPSIDVRYLARQGAVAPGRRSSMAWRDDQRVSIESSGTRVVFSVGSRVCQVIDLMWTSCSLGGERVWVRCPDCKRRVAILYLGGNFACRVCHGLYYESQRTRGRCSALIKLQRLRHRLGGSANLLEPFPDKPKKMRHATYERLHRQADTLERAYLGEMMSWLSRMNAEPR